jgi:hypothetical protein
MLVAAGLVHLFTSYQVRTLGFVPPIASALRTVGLPKHTTAGVAVTDVGVTVAEFTITVVERHADGKLEQ